MNDKFDLEKYISRVEDGRNNKVVEFRQGSAEIVGHSYGHSHNHVFRNAE